MDASYPEEVGARELRALDVHEMDKLVDDARVRNPTERAILVRCQKTCQNYAESSYRVLMFKNIAINL